VFGIDLSELLIIAVVLMVMIGMLVGVVLLVVSLVRRRQAVPVRPPHAEPDAAGRESRD